MTILCYPKCSTCKRALQWLEAHGAAYIYRDIQKQNPSAEEIAAWQRQSGLPLKRFFNTSGMKYRDLRIKEKLPGMSEEEQRALLATDGLLVKRPILIGEGFVLVGFREKEWAESLG